MHRLVRVGLLLCASLWLTACPRGVRPPPPAPGRPSELPAPDLRGATVYQVNPAASELHIYVYRGGTLARLGHNHVMTSRALSGRAWLHPKLASSGFELSFPVAELVVDDPTARRAAGSDFPPEIPLADKEGTKRNMLRPEVLDAERYPRVSLRSVSVAGTRESPQITARITIKDASRDVVVPVAVRIDGARLQASGELDILQTNFGIKPFSVALGTLEVQDRLHVRFKVIADKT